MSWNHNVHYHGDVLDAIPPHCQRALDVGCGQGLLTRKLAERSDEVVAIDVDEECLDLAKAACGSSSNIAFIKGDVLAEPLAEDSFDFIAAVATLHHLPLRIGLVRLRNLLRSGGVLAVVGLYRASTPMDYVLAAATLPFSRAIRLFRGEEKVGAPLRDPTETLAEIRRECDAVMPGGVFRRRLFFRYTFVWRKHRSEH